MRDRRLDGEISTFSLDGGMFIGWGWSRRSCWAVVVVVVVASRHAVPLLERRFQGRMETGVDTISDPKMGIDYMTRRGHRLHDTQLGIDYMTRGGGELEDQMEHPVCMRSRRFGGKRKWFGGRRSE